MSPVLRGTFAPTLPIFALFLASALMQRVSGNARIQAVLAVANWILLVLFVGQYAMQLGGKGA